MKLSGIVILSTVLMAMALTVGGGYITIDNLVHPQGNLFEGIILTAIGILSLLVIALANSIGNMIILFKNVYVNQLEMQQQMIEHFKDIHEASRPRSITDILGKLGPSSMTITDLNTGETTSTPLGSHESLGKLNEMIMNALAKKSAGRNKELSDMTREELEEELAKAVKKDDFERANDIKLLIRKLDSKDNPGEDKEDPKD